MTLLRRQLYMLPTGQGLTFALVLLVLLLAAVNYGNGLVYALVFLLAGLGIVSMLYTQRNLLHLGVSAGACAPAFAGEDAVFGILLGNGKHLPRFGLCVEVDKRPLAQVDIQSNECVSVPVRVPARKRGRLSCPPLVISTRYPLGLLRSWSARIRLDYACLIYPAPAGATRPLPVGHREAGGDAGGNAGDNDFAGLRDYRPGDSPRRVHWKAWARGQGLLTKEFAGERAAEAWLDWDLLPELGTEERLSQLCRWALDADRAGVRYGLRLPGAVIPPDAGPHHLHRVLSALALF